MSPYAVGDLVRVLTGVHQGKIGSIAEPPFKGCSFYVALPEGALVGPYLADEIEALDFSAFEAAS